MSISKKSNLTVIIPFYNEEKTLPQIVRKVLSRPEVKEIVLVNDGSKDNSLEKILHLRNISSKIRIYSHKKNQGKGAAMITGLNYAKGDYIIFQDADLETFPSDYPKLLKPLKSGFADFVIGTRWANHNGYFLAQTGNKLLTYVINILFFAKYQDSYCGYKMAKTRFIQNLNLNSKGFEIEAEIVCKVALNKAKIDQVDIRYNPRTYKEGKKINYKDIFKGILKILEIRLKN